MSICYYSLSLSVTDVKQCMPHVCTQQDSYGCPACARLYNRVQTSFWCNWRISLYVMYYTAATYPCAIYNSRVNIQVLEGTPRSCRYSSVKYPCMQILCYKASDKTQIKLLGRGWRGARHFYPQNNHQFLRLVCQNALFS